MLGRWVFLVAALTLIPMVGVAQVPSSTAQQTLTVPLESGVSLEVLDWGGKGLPLVFLAGLGESAREFDDFAPRFTDHYRVLGISRRGSGGSSDLPPKQFEELVADIVGVLDKLNISRAVLVGHSYAGSEMAVFGERYSDRCAALIYLDSAYNYSDPQLGDVIRHTPPPRAPRMQAADSASATTVQSYYERVSGMKVPLSSIRAQYHFAQDGKLVGPRPSATRDSIGGMLPAPHWDAVGCPSLGVYAIPAPLETHLPYYAQLDEAARRRGAAYVEAFGAWTKKNRDEFGRSSQNRVIEFPSANHYFFMQMPDETEGVIREFLTPVN